MAKPQKSPFGTICCCVKKICVIQIIPHWECVMPLNLSNSEALGRTYAAARMMAGLDQAELANAAGLSAGTISNVERGRDSKPDTLRSIRRALSREGVLVGFSRNNGLASVSISFAADDGEEE
jgi:DNA-binding XRE family transcriptional regulator